MKTTRSARNEDFLKNGRYQRAWYCVDATDKTLGRLATEVTRVLRGKHKPIFTPHVDTGDYVVVVNADKIKLTGRKWTDKIYYHHTGYPGGLKAFQAIKKFERDPTSLIQLAVKGMMTKSALGRSTLRKLKVYAGSEHPHGANKPQPLDI